MQNYRGISILNITYKVLSSIPCEKLKPYVVLCLADQTQIADIHIEADPGKDIRIQTITFSSTSNKHWKFRTPPSHEPARNATQVDQLIQDDHFQHRVKVDDESSDVFITKRGVKHGDGLSCDLLETWICHQENCNISRRNHYQQNSTTTATLQRLETSAEGVRLKTIVFTFSLSELHEDSCATTVAVWSLSVVVVVGKMGIPCFGNHLVL